MLRLSIVLGPWTRVVLVAAIAAASADGGDVAASELLSRPTPLDRPTRVRVGLYVVDIVDVDDANQTFTADFVLWASWPDPRLSAAGSGLRELEMSRIWSPRLTFLGERGLEKKFPDAAYADADGTVLYRQRFFGEISSPTDLADFPFDHQILRLQTVAAGHTPEEVELLIEPTRTGRSAEMSVVDWKLGEAAARVARFDYAADDRVFPTIVLELPARRHASYYVWKVIFPLVLVVFMSWTVFWINPAHAGPQIGVATTSILTLIAYQFVLGRLVPELSYLTRLDLFTIGSTALVFLALLEVITTSALAERDHPELANRIDRWARIVFPAAFAAVIVGAFVL